MKQYRRIRSVIAILLAFAIVLPLCPAFVFAASTFDVSQWDTTGWMETNEYGHTVLTADSTTDSAALVYKGNLYGATSIEADIRYNQSRWGEASGGFVLYTAAGDEWYVDYRADANAIRIRRNGAYITYNALGFTPKANEWVHFELAWDDTNLYILVNGEVFLSADYASYGDVFNGSSTFKFYQWGQPMSVRALKVNYDISALWDAPTATAAKENGETVMTVSGDTDTITYKGSMAGVSRIDADIRSPGSKWGEASNGILIYTEEGVEWYIDYRNDVGGNALRIRRNGNYMTYTGLQLQPDEWYHWTISWDGVRLYAYIDGNLILTCEYASLGDSFGANSNPAKFCHWGRPFAVKNIELSGPDWQGANWSVADEENTTVYTPSVPENGSAENASARLDYYGSLDGVNTVEMDMRYNQSYWGEASSGVLLYSNEGAEWMIDYRADASAVRIRRNGEYITYTGLTNAPAADAWMHWTLHWDDTNISIAIDSETILTQNYASFGDVFDESASFAIYHWGQPASVRNMTFSSKETPVYWTSDWSGAWTAGMEGENPILKATEGGPQMVLYTGSIKEYNSFEADIRTDSTIDTDGNVGMLLRGVDSQGNAVDYFISYRGFDRMIRVGETTLGYLSYDLQVGTYYHWQLLWGNGVITLMIDNAVVATTAYDPNAVSFAADGATVGFSHWKRMSTVKNVKLSYMESEPDTSNWELNGWTAAFEGTEVVFSGNPESDGNGLIYKGSLDGCNVVSFQMRYNQTRWGEASGGLCIYDIHNDEWFIDYRADANSVRIRRNGEYISYPALYFTPAADEWMRWQIKWDATNIYVFINDTLVAQADYAARGDDLSSGVTMKFWEWGQPVSVKNIEMSKEEEKPDTSGWELKGWTAAFEGTEVVFSGDPASDGNGLYYQGPLNGCNTVSFQMRYNQTRWAEASCGIVLKDDNGDEWFIDYRADANSVRIRRNGNYIAYPGLYFTPAADEWMNWQIIWTDTVLYVKINGEMVAEANYASYGDSFDEGVSMNFWEWGQPSSIKNVALSEQTLTGWIPNASWIKTDENGETVYSAQIPEFNDGIWPTLSYVGSLEGINSISYQLRYNKSWYVEAWGGLILTEGNGNVWTIDYRADANAVRIRRNGNYLASAGLSFTPADNTWMDFQVIWSDTTLYLKVSDEIVLEVKYSSFGDVFNADTSVCFQCWGQPISVKDITMETVKPSAWNFVDLEFNSAYSVETFHIQGGLAKHQGSQMIVDISAGGMSMESGRIEVSPGSLYSAFLPVRNTLVVRLKNDTAADEIKLYFISTLHQEYSEECCKTFQIEPYSDYTTYFFNLSDVIHMGSAANPYKYTSQVMDSEGYLRGFKLVMPENVTEGSVAIDAITFEREDPLYEYLGEITSTVADKKTEKITINGKANSALAGQIVTIYESAVNNYNEAMSYPVNTEHTTEMVDIEKLTTAAVQADGSFTATVPLYAEDGISRLSTLFLAWIGDKKVAGHFSVDNYEDFSDIERFEVPNLVVNVTDPQFGAKGDAFTDDTKAIQAAIDYVAAQGGGVVILPGDTSTWYGRRYIATNINLKSNIELRIEKGAMIWQSQREEEYDYSSNYFLEKPVYGHDNDREGVVWAHSINDNLPLLYVGGEYDRATGKWGEAITNVRITGGGTVRMLDIGGEQPDPHNYAWNSNICVGCANRIHVAPIVFWHADNCDLVDITIQRTNSWHVTTSGSNNMYYANNTLEQAACINSDSFGCSNSKNMTIFRNFVYGNDDGVTLSTFAEEKRAHVFYFVDPDRDNSIENINIISNQIWNGLGIAFIPWGSGGEDASRYLTKNILIYDNVLGGESCAIGSWPDNPTYGWSSYYTYNLDNGETDDWSAIQDVKIINNRLRKPYNLRVVQVTNLIIENTAYKGEQIGYYQSRAATNFLHGDFDKVIRSTEEANGFKDETNWVVGLTNWSSLLGENGSVGSEKVRADLKYSGYIRGDGQLWQGIYLILGAQKLTMKVFAKSGDAAVFVADQDGNVLKELPVAQNTDFEEITFDFTVPASGIYRLGVKHQGTDQEIVYLDDADVQRSEINSAEIDNAVTATYPFDEEKELEDFLLFSSANGGFQLLDGKLAAVGTDGEYKAVLKTFDRKYWSTSVEIHPGASGEINAGLYIGASGGGNKLDQIRALGILVESNFTGWNDAANRVDLVIGSFPNWTELGRYTSETGAGNSLFTNGTKEPLKLRVDVNDTIVTVTLSLLRDETVFIQAVFEYSGQYDLHYGTIGLRTNGSDAQFDNLTLKYTESEKPSDPETGEKPTDLVDFESAGCADKFDFYHSSNGGFVIQDGKLVPTGEEGEFKAIYKDNGAKFSSVSVDIYPNANGEINSGIYIGASKAADGVDKIKALGILVESNFSGWDDAVNRIDLVVGQFPIWKELHRYTSETGNNNALYVGSKEPLNLRVDIDGKVVTITLSLLSNPSIFVTTVYEYTGSDDLSLGNVGLRSAFSGASFDNFSVIYTDTAPVPGTGDRFFAAAAAASMMLSAAACVTVIQKKKKED